MRHRAHGPTSASSDGNDLLGAPGRAPLTQRHAAKLDEDTARSQRAILDAAWAPGPVQLARDGHSGLDDAEVQAAATHGLSAGGGPLPHLDAIQRSFGEHDVSGVTAHVGGPAKEASQAMGAHAYATGDQVAFAQQPDLFLAAHEAAHVVQQRGGVQLSSAVGQAGDAYEQHADAVAAKVVAGESAADLLGAGAAAPSQHGAVQRKVSKQDQDALDISNDGYFLDAFIKYTSYPAFRSLGAGGKPVPKIELGDDKMQKLADGIHATVSAIKDDAKPDHLVKALDLWGANRPGVQKVFARCEKRGKQVHPDLKQAHDGFDRLETYTVDSAAQEAIEKGMKEIGGEFRVDAKLHQAEYDAARAALIETLAAVDKAKGLPETAKLYKEHRLEEIVQITKEHKSFEQSLTIAERVGLAVKGQHPMEWPRHILRVAKLTIKGIALLANTKGLWKIAPEAGSLFRQFAERVAADGDVLVKSQAFLAQALNVAQVAKGLYDLIGGIASGDADRAMTGARNMLMGGTSILMEGAGAGFGAGLAAPMLAYIFVETIRECIAVGKLLREIPHVQEVIAVTRFVEAAGKLGERGAHAYAAISERYAGHTYSHDKQMQLEVQAQIEEHMKIDAAKLVDDINKQLVPSYRDKSNVYALGKYEDAIAAMGPEAVGAMNYIASEGKKADPGTVAWNAIKLFGGIGRMGQWAQVSHGTFRDKGENKDKKDKLDKEIEGEWKRERDKRYDWQKGPKGPSEEELEESMR